MLGGEQGVAMRRHRLRWALVGLAAAIAAGVVVLWPQPNRVTEANIHRIQVGMTRNEVEAILGPPGDYSTGPVVYERPAPGPGIDSVEADNAFEALQHDARDAARASDEGTIAINYDFDEQPTVSMVEVSIYRRKPLGLLDNMLWRVKRQWKRWFPGR